MADVLVDTSVWIDFFRNEQTRTGDLLDDLLEQDRVVLCGIVEMEIIQGLRDSDRSSVQSVLALLPFVETSRDDFIEAGRQWRALRRRGTTIPPTDSIIAAVARRHDLSLFALDVHFDAIPNLKRLRPQRVV